MVFRRELIGRLPVTHGLTDLVADEIRHLAVGFSVAQHVPKRRAEPQAAGRPRLFQQRGALLVVKVEHARVANVERVTIGHPLRPRPDFAIVFLNVPLKLLGQRRIAGRHRIVGRSLKHGEVRRNLRHLRRHLNAGGAGADLTDPLARQVNALMGPFPSVVPIAFKPLEARNVRNICVRQTAHRGDEKPSAKHLAALGRDHPLVRVFIERCAGHRGVQLDVAPQVELVGHKVEVAADLVMVRVSLCPLPFLLKLRRERVGVVVTLRIAARPRVAVPIPRAPDAARLVQHAHAKPHLIAQLMQRIKPRKAGTHDDHIELLRCCRPL